MGCGRGSDSGHRGYYDNRKENNHTINLSYDDGETWGQFERHLVGKVMEGLDDSQKVRGSEEGGSERRSRSSDRIIGIP